MRILSTFLASIFLLTGFTFAQQAKPSSGAWEFRETAEGETAEWHYDIIVPDDEMIVGVGFPLGDLDDPLAIDGEDFLKLSFFILQAQDEGGYSGFFLETDGVGEQVSFGIEGKVSDNGKTISWNGRNQLGDVITQAEGEPINQFPEGPFWDGEWMVREIVLPQHGGWDIFWEVEFSVGEDGISGSGNKATVNGREATAGEQKTVLRMNLGHPDEAGRVEGSGVETNAKGEEIKTSYMGWISPTGEWFFLQSFENDAAVSLIYGMGG